MMKNLKLIGIIALAAVIGLSMISCGDETDCAIDGHKWEVSKTNDNEVVCSVCDEVGPRCNLSGHVYEGNWKKAGTNGAEKDCKYPLCFDTKKLGVSDLYGDWAQAPQAEGTTWKINISATEIKLSAYSTDGTLGSSFAITGYTYSALGNDRPSGTPSKDDCPVGFNFSGGTPASTGTTFGSSNTQMAVFIALAGDKCSIRLGSEYQSRSFDKVGN